jgi:hypothetical protein
LSANRLLGHEITTDWYWCNAILLVPVSCPTNEEDTQDEPTEEVEPDDPNEPKDKKAKTGGKFYLEHYIVV